jgi:predicted TIM-barrel fold metal-dependent hydrolase
MKPFAQALVDTRRDRVVWGTNWPHPNHFPPSTAPNDADLVDVFCDWFADADVRQQVMVENPARLYGFAEDGSDEQTDHARESHAPQDRA